MSYWLDESRYRHEEVTIRTLWVTIALSLLVHTAALLVVLQHTHLLLPEEEGPELAKDRLQVRLAIPTPAPPQTPEPSREIIALPKPPPRPPRETARTPPPQVVIAPTRAAPAMVAPPSATPPVPAPPRTTPPIEGDLWSYIQARRRERGAPEAPAIADPKAELNASIAANLPQPATGAATSDRKTGGGIFEIKRMGYDDAAFMFFGWNKEMERRTPQLIEVRKGNNSDMRIAVVRRMIAIIREHEKTDFVWRSSHRDHDVVLSARLSDNAALESYLMHDFFDNPQ